MGRTLLQISGIDLQVDKVAELGIDATGFRPLERRPDTASSETVMPPQDNR